MMKAIFVPSMYAEKAMECFDKDLESLTCRLMLVVGIELSVCSHSTHNKEVEKSTLAS